MDNRMTFDVDRTTVAEGEVVEVRWNCSGADRVELKIDNGYRASVMNLETEGTKRFKLNRSKGRTALTITAWKDGKHGSKTLKVRVTEIPTARTETLDSEGRTVGGLRQWWQDYRMRRKQLPPEKQTIYRILLILWGILLVSLLLPAVLWIGVAGVAVYLTYLLWKK